MGKDKEKVNAQGCTSASEEEHLGLLRTQNQSNNRGKVKGWTTIIKDGKLPLSFCFCCLLMLVACFILLPQSEGIRATLRGTPLKQALIFNITLVTNSNTTLEKPVDSKNHNRPRQTEHSLACPPPNVTRTCPSSPPLGNTFMELQEESSSSNQTESCPDYFRWIHEDLKRWKEKGISREAVEAGERLANFRLVVLQGRVYVKTYRRCFQTRDVFTIWGIVQLIRVYRGKLPDFDLMFECGDRPVIKKAQYVGPAANGSNPSIPPMFGYCGDDDSFDIPLPDWSFWGWNVFMHEINIKPWEAIVEDLKEGNKRVKWVDRVPFAYWKGNLHMGRRGVLLRCNSTKAWNAEIYAQRWGIEVKHGFRHSNVADQCTHRYKIYMEGRAWSVSEKYLQACDSMLLLVLPRYYEFFTRSLVPLKHYWPINPWRPCGSIKFAVDWGNNSSQKAQEIGNAGSKFIMEELKMKYIYDYMFHLLSEYGRLLRYKPTVPPGAVEVCLESMVCTSQGRERKWKIDSMTKGPSRTSPCAMLPPYDPQELSKFQSMKNDIIGQVFRWEASGDIRQAKF